MFYFNKFNFKEPFTLPQGNDQNPFDFDQNPSSHASAVHELLDVQAGFRKGRGTRDQIANIHWIMDKAREL